MQSKRKIKVEIDSSAGAGTQAKLIAKNY